MNPTNFYCPSDITTLQITDYRPNKALYTNVLDNNKYRAYMQQNANNIRQYMLKQYVMKMDCMCDSYDHPTPFDRSAIDNIKNS